MPDSYVTHEIKELAKILTMFIVIGLGLPLFALFVLGNFQSIEDPDFVLQRGFLTLYTTFMLIGIVGITSIKVREILRGDNRGILDYAPLHDFDQDALLGKLKFLPNSITNIFRSPVKTYILFTIIFAIVGLVSSQVNYFFAQPGSITQQQISKPTKAILGMEPPAAAENLFFSLIIFMLYGFFRWMQAKLKMNEILFWFVTIIFVPLITSLLWRSYHGIVYGDQEVALLATFTFAWFGTFLTLVFGSVLPWWAWHQQNNLFYELARLYSSDAVLIGTIGVLSFIAIIYIVSIYLTRKQNVAIERVPP